MTQYVPGTVVSVLDDQWKPLTRDDICPPHLLLVSKARPHPTASTMLGVAGESWEEEYRGCAPLPPLEQTKPL